MSKKLEALQKQKEAIELQIVQEGLVAKNKNRVERLVLKLLQKHPGLFASNPTELEKGLAEAFKGLAANLGK